MKLQLTKIDLRIIANCIKMDESFTMESTYMIMDDYNLVKSFMENYKMENSNSKKLSKDVFAEIEKYKPESFLLHPDPKVASERNKVKKVISKNKYVNSEVKKAIKNYLQLIKKTVKDQYEEKIRTGKKFAAIALGTTIASGLDTIAVGHIGIIPALASTAISVIITLFIFEFVRPEYSILPDSVRFAIRRVIFYIINKIRGALKLAKIKPTAKNIGPINKELKSAVDTINKMEKTLFRLSKGKIKLPKIKLKSRVK